MTTTDTLTDAIIGLAIAVHRALGPGLLESVYEECLCYELGAAGLEFERQVPVPVSYKKVNLQMGFRADVIVARQVLIELKAVESLSTVHQAQILTYMRLSGLGKGLLINFNSKLLRDGIRRFVL